MKMDHNKLKKYRKGGIPTFDLETSRRRVKLKLFLISILALLVSIDGKSLNLTCVGA